MTLTKNPLFPDPTDAPDEDKQPDGYVLPGKASRIEPLHSPDEIKSTDDGGVNPAVNLIRSKLAQLYDESEPDASKEATEAEQVPFRSPHQQFMYELSTSGKSLAEIQTEWHNYYVSLPDDQKHQVWQEFYENNTGASVYETAKPTPVPKPNEDKPVKSAAKAAAKAAAPKKNGIVVGHDEPETPEPVRKPARQRSRQERQELRSSIRRKVQARAVEIGTAHKQNLHSLLFGLATGLIVLAIFMFSFFNEVIITPFIQPGKASATPIIIDNDSIAADGSSKVIIPKINVEIPVIYSVTSSDESVIENNLENGVVHYPTTEVPGQKGNVAIFGHSSNNIFNGGHYKFAFVLLHTLKKGDMFYLTYHKTVYAYKVITRQVVDPSDVGVLNDVPGQTATATLITCDPPGTSLHRLVVVGQQVSPSPTKNTASTTNSATATSAPADRLAGNGPSLWSRLWNAIF